MKCFKYQEIRYCCCDYNFVYTLFPAHILHNMDIIIRLVLCIPQSRFATLSIYYHSRSLLFIIKGYGPCLPIIFNQTQTSHSFTFDLITNNYFSQPSQCLLLLGLLRSVDLISYMTSHISKIMVPTSRHGSTRFALSSDFED